MGKDLVSKNIRKFNEAVAQMETNRTIDEILNDPEIKSIKKNNEAAGMIIDLLEVFRSPQAWRHFLGPNGKRDGELGL